MLCWTNFASEDAYITFHAAINSDWIRAATSPTWAFVLSLFPNPEIAARVIMLLADAVAIGFASSLPWAGFLTFAVLWAMPFMASSAMSGLETHLIGVGFVAATLHPCGFAAAAFWRLDYAIISGIAAWKRWYYAALGAVFLFTASVILWGSLIPRTAGSKLAVYGIHWLSGVGWLLPEQVGWMMIPLVIAAGFSRRWPMFAAALAPLGIHAILGTPLFWWYLVPSVAMMIALIAHSARRWYPLVALGLVFLVWPHQIERFASRNWAESMLYAAGEEMARLGASGTVLLEPAGIIPYLNPSLKVVDEVGLVEPWMAERRALGTPWLTDALDRYKPDWLILRVGGVLSGETPGKGRYLRPGQTWRQATDGYEILFRPDPVFIGDKKGIPASAGRLVIAKRNR